jgi:hypothetical protein
LNTINDTPQGDYSGDFGDADSVISIVATQCAATAECPLHEATADAVKERLFGILSSLRTKVVTIYNGVENMVYIDRKLALSTLWAAVYWPYTSMAPLFEALSDLEKGDGRKLYEIYGNLTITCQDCHPLTLADAGASPDANIAIQCADSGPISDNLTDLSYMFGMLSGQTYFADMAFAFSSLCAYAILTLHLAPTFSHSHTHSGWPLESKSRFKGTSGGDTSFPLLFIGNTNGASLCYEITSTY